jgi:hypothetical protein
MIIVIKHKAWLSHRISAMKLLIGSHSQSIVSDLLYCGCIEMTHSLSLSLTHPKEPQTVQNEKNWMFYSGYKWTQL